MFVYSPLGFAIQERPKNDHQKLPQTRLYLERSGMSLADLDSLNTIHVRDMFQSNNINLVYKSFCNSEIRPCICFQ